ncbi:MAG: hypothetical protein QOD07_546 [Frankiaceae bacterium]|nr:hypothetical protein [Frankiaceae bacterium]
MAERNQAFQPLPAAVGTDDRMPRCCPTHPDWATLTQHLVDEFPEIVIGNIVREVGRAKDAAEQVGLDTDDALVTGELIARHQLSMLAGRMTEVARLDPERHARAGVPSSRDRE